MRRNIFLIGTVTVILFFVTCTKDVGKLPSSNNATPSACDTVTYTKHIKPIIDAHCISCHGTSPLPGAPMLTTYSQASNNAQRIKNTVVDGIPERMPQNGSPLLQAEQDLIVCWLNNGKKE